MVTTCFSARPRPNTIGRPTQALLLSGEIRGCFGHLGTISSSVLHLGDDQAKSVAYTGAGVLLLQQEDTRQKYKTHTKKKGNLTSPQRRKGEFNLILSCVRQLDYWKLFF